VNYLDSNVWLYALMATVDNWKRLRALDLVESGDITVSLHVINDVCRVLSKKGGLSEDLLRSVIRGFYRRFPVVQLDETDVLRSSELRERYGISFWDGIHVAAALKAGASKLYSEDMHDGLVVDGRLTIENPFKKPA
jgi:predicted nucleic acid-binding protein